MEIYILLSVLIVWNLIITGYLVFNHPVKIHEFYEEDKKTETIKIIGKALEENNSSDFSPFKVMSLPYTGKILLTSKNDSNIYKILDSILNHFDLEFITERNVLVKKKVKHEKKVNNTTA